MPKFRSIRSPERQAEAVVGRLVNLGALRRNPKRPASVRTVANYRDCLLQIARRIAPEGRELRNLTPETAVEYLRTRTADLGQKALDMHRQALQAMLVHISRWLPEGERLTVVRSRKPRRTGGRAYRPEQIRMVAAAQNARNGLSTLIAHAAGLRAHELLTLARPGEQPPDRRPARPEKFAGRPGRNHTVIGKGGLVRLIRLPDHLADRLEERRREEPARVTDRGVHYTSRYDVAGGTPWSVSFGSASKRALGWTAGAHGARHAYAQERMDELQCSLVRADALETVSQELGPFSPWDYGDLLEVIPLTIHLSETQIEVLDSIMSGNRDYMANDGSRGHAIGEILLKYHHLQLLGERADIKAEADAAQQALRKKLDAVSRERDAVRSALDAERATRRRDRERNARRRERLRGARNALRRLGESRATYRDLSLRVEAALLRTVPRRDLGGLEVRLARALRSAGFEMPEAPDG